MEGWLTGLASGIKGAESGLEKALARKQKEAEDARKQKLEDAMIKKYGAETAKDYATAESLKNKQLEEKPPTEAQARAGVHATNLESSSKIMQDLEAKGYDPSAVENKLQGLLPRALQSPEYQQYEAARNQYTLAAGYAQSGSNVAEREENKITGSYTSGFGDSPESRALKAQSRERLAEAVRGMAGKAPKTGGGLLTDKNQVPPGGGSGSMPISAQAGAPKAASIPIGQVIVTPDGKTLIRQKDGSFTEK